MGHPYTSWSRQLETVMLLAEPPPKRKTDQRVLKELLVMVMNFQLPNMAHASSCDFTMQLETVAYSALMK